MVTPYRYVSLVTQLDRTILRPTMSNGCVETGLHLYMSTGDLTGFLSRTLYRHSLGLGNAATERPQPCQIVVPK